MLKDKQDAFGHEIYDYYKGKPHIYEVVEREDGYIDISGGPAFYFSEYKDWSKITKQAIKFARGRIIDIGCGAGRHALYLQKKGHVVTGIDISPLAIKVCRLRGLKDARVLSITGVSSKIGIYDTIIMFGNNFGLFANAKRAHWLLRRFYRMTSSRGRIIAQCIDPYKTKVPEHLWYHRYNRKRRRMGGQIRIRVRYKKYITPWFDYLFVNTTEMRTILKGTGWKLARIIGSANPAYIAIIEKSC